MKLIISFKHQVHEIDVSLDTILSDLRIKVTELTGVAVENQKLLYKTLSNIKSDSEKNTWTLERLQVPDGAKIMVIGSSNEDITKIHQFDERKASQTPLKPGKPYQEIRTPSRYTFGAIEILSASHYVNQQRASNILDELRSDIGVKAIMEHYRWSIGKLIEICPKEQPNILGYNRNKGEIIALRLRTDDLAGFRHFNDIRKVLLHELTHMIHSDHNADFWALNRRLNQEVTSRNWTKVGGHALSNKEFYSPAETASSGESNASFQGGVYVLGGNSTQQQTPDRETLARAALLRLTKEESDMMKSCGFHK